MNDIEKLRQNVINAAISKENRIMYYFGQVELLAAIKDLFDSEECYIELLKTFLNKDDVDDSIKEMVMELLK